MAKHCLKSEILESDFDLEAVIACLDLKVPLICEFPDGRTWLLVGYCRSDKNGMFLVAADVAQNRREVQQPDRGMLRSLHCYPPEEREKKREQILESLENGESLSISLTATFVSFLANQDTAILVVNQEAFPRARMTVITAPEVDMERIAGLFSIL